jgi:hypothetical protein
MTTEEGAGMRTGGLSGISPDVAFFHVCCCEIHHAAVNP